MRHEHVICRANDKIKALTGSQPNLYKKDFRFAFFSLSFIFHILLYVCHSLLLLFFYFNIENNVMFMCGGRILIFFVVYVCFIRKTRKYLKKKLCFQTLSISFIY